MTARRRVPRTTTAVKSTYCVEFTIIIIIICSQAAQCIYIYITVEALRRTEKVIKRGKNERKKLSFLHRARV